MSAAIDQIKEVQDKLIERLEGVKEPVAGAVERVIVVISDRLPEFPALPLIQKLPTSRELVDNGFEFAGRLLDTNKRIVVSVVDATAPLGDKIRNGAAEAPKAPAAPRKSAAKKATTKKTA